jgi:hypothetical protein
MNNNFAEVSEVIEAIKKEIQAAQQVVIGEPKLGLTEVILEINALVTRSTKGGVKVLVASFITGPSLEGGLENAQSQKITISLKPPEPIITQSGLDLSRLDIANTIVLLRRELQAGLASEPRLLPSKLDIEIEFSVQKDLEGSGGIKLIFVEIGPKVKRSSKNLHKITLHFEEPDLPL